MWAHTDRRGMLSVSERSYSHETADDWVAAIFVLLQIDDEIRSCLALAFDATIADAVILEELDLDTISLPQDDAPMLDFAVDHLLHNVGSMSVEGGENFRGVPLVTLDLVKTDWVGVKIGATEDVVSRHKQQCLRFIHDLFGCWLVLLIGMRVNPVILLSGKEDYCTAEVPWTSYIFLDWPSVLSTLLGRNPAEGIITDLLNVLGGRARVGGGRGKRANIWAPTSYWRPSWTNQATDQP